MDMFLSIYQPKRGKNPMANVKGIDGSSLPPCHSVLLEQIKRTNAICSVWRNGTVFNPQVILPSGNGWQLVEEKYSPVWFQGDMVPTTIEDMILDFSNEEEMDEDATNVSSDDESDCSLSDIFNSVTNVFKEGVS
ncbi:hypothetical protein OUZ56_026367 [Daphnia magna]|uniref:Uncharacterized protein n=1 Tax=Daphnia magna TaxID=35525 RepID=A0ABQ9ZLJ3_9CRUS|nr:hypothetical protein OUZ56_026367 [Daphnia magna]